MMRRTKKYKAAMDCIVKHKLPIGLAANDVLYERMESNNFFWNQKQGVWEKKSHKPSTSIFEADDGTPTGIVKIRVMAHPEDLEAAVKALKKCAGIRLIEISEKTYPNRKGTGERIYTTAILDGAK